MWDGHLLDVDRYYLLGHGEGVEVGVGTGRARVGDGWSCIRMMRLTAQPCDGTDGGIGNEEAISVGCGMTLRRCGRSGCMQPLPGGDLLDDQR
jgi:hypothetical protein